MRTSLVSAILALSFAIAPAAARACGIYGDMSMLQPGVVVGDQFVCVTTAGHLVLRDLKKGTHRDYTELKTRFLSPIDVADNRACVASREHVHIIDLATGKELHKLAHAAGPVAVGFIDKEQVFAASTEAVEVFDLSTGKLTRRIELRKKESAAADQGTKSGDAKDAKASDKRAARGEGSVAWHKEGVVPCCRQGNLLFVALPGEYQRGFDMSPLASVAVVDLQKGRVTDEAKVARGIISLSSVKGRLLVRYGVTSYGMPLQYCSAFPIAEGKIDVKAKDTRRYDISLRFDVDHAMPTTAFASGEDLFVCSGKRILRMDAHGKCVAMKETLTAGRALVGVWNNQALVTEYGELEVVALAPVEPKPAAAE